MKSFSEDAQCSCMELLQASPADWRALLPWLDVSGLALYLLEQISQLGLLSTLPQDIAERLQYRQSENTQRTLGMLQESVAIQQAFQQAGISYAVLKGISLSPVAVPRSELRHQFDLDYLIEETCASQARRILEDRGYRLFAISGKSMEFKINETPLDSALDLYKNLPYRGVELHIEHSTTENTSRLNRVVHRNIAGISMPVLSPIDLFIGQAMHAFKDVCSSFSRASHLLEFYRHVWNRRKDEAFWQELRRHAEHDRRTCLGMGVLVYLLTSLLGNFAPQQLTSWTVDALPSSMRLYIDRYGKRAVFHRPPGTKLYLLLQQEMERNGIFSKRTVKESLLPLRLPVEVVRGSQSEPIRLRMARYRVQFRFVLSRVQFHIVEGLRYMVEAYRWRRQLERLS